MNKHLRCIGACLCLLFSMTMQAEKGPYGIFSEKDTMLTVYYGDIPEDAYRYDPTVPDNSDVWLTPPSGSPTNLGKLTKVRITKSFRDYKPTSLKKFFAYFTNFRTVEGINNMRTETVTDMSEMFSNCKSLKEIDLRSFNTSSVVSMRRMFYECRALTSVDLTTFNTSSVSDMYGMFWQSALETIDLSSFNTRQATNMGYMFFNMKSLKTVIVGSDWLLNSSSLDAVNMFEYCEKIQGGKGTTYDESHVDHTYAHVDGGAENPGYLTLKTQKKVPYAEGTYSNLKRGPYYPFGYDKLVIKYGYMPASSNAFELNCDGKTWWKNDVDSFFAYSETITIDPSMKEYPLTTTAHMFDNCTSVRYLKGLSNLNTDSVTDMSAMFKGCASLGKYLDFKDFNTSNVTRMDSMFMDMGRFIAEDETGTSDPEKWKKFRYTLDLRNLDTRNVTSMEKMFFLLYWVDVLDISSFDTRKVTNMSNMFRDGNGYDGKTPCLKTVYVGDNWSTASLINTEEGIFGKELNGGDGGVSALFGGAGTYKDVLYDFYGYEVAHVDGGVENPGLFTSHNPKTFPVLYGVKNGSGVFRISYGIAPKSAYTYGSAWAWMGGPENGRVIDLYGNSILNPLEIYGVEIDSTVKNCSPKVLACLFYDFEKLFKITGLEYFRTDSVRSLSLMFWSCKDLTSIDLHSFDTRQVTGVQGMFYDCESLKTIYVGENWIMTDKAIQNYSVEMFYGCSKLVGGAGTKCKGGNATYAHIDGGPNDPGYMTDYRGIPYAVGKRNLRRPRLYDNDNNAICGFDTLIIKYGIPEEDEDAFPIICDGENWWKYDKDSFSVFANIIYIDSSFHECPLKTTANMFNYCYNANEINGLKYINTDSVVDMSRMFAECNTLVKLDLKGFKTPNVTKMDAMFFQVGIANSYADQNYTGGTQRGSNVNLDLTDFDTRNVTSMKIMFGYARVKELDISSFDTRKVTDMTDMLVGADDGYDGEEFKTLLKVYVGENWSVEALENKKANIFGNTTVGCAGTDYTARKSLSDYTLARIDEGEVNPGLLSPKNKSNADTFFVDGLKYVTTIKWEQGYGWKHEASVGYADLAGDTIVIPEKVQIDGTDYTVTGIMDEGFINQFKLKSVVIPESVTEIGEKAFYENHNIISLDIPSSVSSIGASAFTTILNVAYAGNAEGGPWGANVLNGEVDYDLKYVFSDSTRTKIVRCFGHDSIIVIPNTVKELGRNSFAKIIELKSVDLNNVEKIDDKALQVTGLQEIALSNKIKYLGEKAFYATNIKKVLLPNSVDSMGADVFRGVDTVCCRWTTVPTGKVYHRGWNYKVNTVIYNCKLLNVSVENSDSSTVEVSGHVGIDAEGAYWYEDSASATIKAVPCKGYEFVQWSDNVKKNPRTFAMTADTAITAEFKAKNYIITYKVDGKVYQRDTVACGDAITDMPTPKKEGYTFVGWDNLQESMPAGNVSVSAIFVVNNYTITYKVNGKVYQVDTVAYGDTIVTPKDPKQENMVFDGWSELPTTMPAKNLTVTGSFSKKAYVLTYKVDGEVYQRDTITSGANITPAREPKKEGYTFSGWKNLPDTMPSKNLTVTGTFEVNSYIITYWANNEIFQVDTVAYGDTIVAAKAAEKEGYTFGGWKDLPETMPAKNLTIRCSFEINYYTLTFMAGGEIFQQDSLMYGEYIYHPETPLRDGYNFIDWDSIPYFMPAKDVIVTAEYEAITYYIYYLVNDAIYLVDSVSYGDSIVAIAYPEKEHYVFSGWSEMPATMPARDLTIEGTLRGEPYVITYMVNDKVYYRDTVEYNSLVAAIEGPEIEGYSFFDWDDIPMYMPAKNVTVTAFLEVEYYTITYKVDGKVYQVDTLAYGDTIVAAKEPKESGLTFSGWSKLPVTMPAKDLIVTGTFSGESSYVITYKVDGKVYQRDTLIYGSTILAAEEPEKEGYTFSGWNNLPATMPAKNVTVNGEFSVNSYHIYYLVDEELYKVDTVAYGDAIEVIANPKKEGYTFSGWSEIPATMPAEDLTVTGTFSGKSYVLTYKVDGKVYQRDTLTNGATIIAPEPEKEGYTFSGWNNLPATMPAKNVTVSGVFEVNIYTITYKVDDELYRVDTVAYGDTIVAAKAPKKSGLTFSGWSKMPVTMPARDLIVAGTFSGESYVVTYKVDGKVYQRDTLIYGSTILAAEEPEKEGYTFSGWNNLPETMPSKNITVKGEFLVNSYYIYYWVDKEIYKVDTVAYGDAIEVIANPKKEGYTFSGWSEIPATMPAEDLTVTGTFSGKSYVLTYKVDGKVYQRDTLTSGATIIAPEPEKEGYTFSGWDKLPETMPAKNVTVSGTFSINNYILTYIVDEEVYHIDTLHYGDAISEIEAPEKTNYIFDGWIELPETMPAEDLTVMASFRPYSGVEEYNSDAVRVWTADKSIFIQVEKNASYVVYNMLGHIMAQGVAMEGDTQIAMPAQGVYQVVVEKSRRTVLVK